jgi:sporulation protein YlmC with PRC-barrel domain
MGATYTDALQGEPVVDRDGRELGAVEEIVIDVQRGAAAYAVIEGLGSALRAVPWRALRMDLEQRRLVVDVDVARFREAPAFDKDHWPAMADATWAKRIHDFYGVRPYWSESDSRGESPPPERKGKSDEDETLIDDGRGVGARV